MVRQFPILISASVFLGLAGCADHQTIMEFIQPDSNWQLIIANDDYYLGPAGDISFLPVRYSSKGCRDLGDFAIVFGDDLPLSCGNFDIVYNRLGRNTQAKVYCKRLQDCAFRDIEVPVVGLTLKNGVLEEVDFGVNGKVDEIFIRR
jgi:hypothetical protein